MRLPSRRSRGRRRQGPPAPFIVGVTRSGTTLLRLMLDAHPDLAIPPETHFVPQLIKTTKKGGASCEEAHGVVTGHRQWGDFDLDSGELLRRYCALDRIDPESTVRTFFELYAEREGKPRWGDKTPNYVKRMRQIQRTIPEARFIHMIRDGRDAALSRFKRLLKEPPPMDTVAERWVKKIEGARADGEHLDHYLEVQYENLVRDTESELIRVSEFLELPWDPTILRYYERAEERLAEMVRDLPGEEGKPTRPADHRREAHLLTSKPPDPSRLARWKEDMDPKQNEIFESVAGDLLAELDYEVVSR
ncbi:MAG: sulfotransferase [Solirubrobacterales bacterium]|nr:MAG: sulfotransferase [Solirubrobacterales bacterium]